MDLAFIKEIIGGPSDFGIGWIVILCSSIIAILVFSKDFAVWISKKISHKKRLLTTISSLAIGTNIEYFKNLLGNPTFINTIENYTENIFINPYFYTQVFTNSDGKVVMYSITTRKDDFNPALSIGWSSVPSWVPIRLRRFFYKDSVIALGKARFSELGEPENIYKRGGEHFAPLNYYSEQHYFGRSGSYLNYAFSISDNSAVFNNIPLYFYENVPENTQELKRFRETNIFNTYTVIGSVEWNEIEKYEIEFGPKEPQLNLLEITHKA
ncbi:MAG: hypothetical protein Q7R67_00995 [bacterium]|nr:hypothetical protein [bacterium]